MVEKGGARAHFMPTYCLPACSTFELRLPCSVDCAYFRLSIYAVSCYPKLDFPEGINKMNMDFQRLQGPYSCGKTKIGSS